MKIRPILKKLKKPYIAAGMILLLLMAVLAAAYGVFYSFYSKMNIQPAKMEYSADLKPPDCEEDDSQGAEVQSYEEYLEENAYDSENVYPFGHPVIQTPSEWALRDNVYHILLIGTDARHVGENSRSDTMIIVSINREKKKIAMISLMRDIYCTVPGVGNTRLNEAYAHGGAAALLDAVEYNFGIHIDDYVTINFYGFMEAVDAIGGVEAEVSAAEIEVMNFYIDELNSLLNLDETTDLLDESDAGTMLLNGKQALAYSRVRYVGNADFERTNRQRIILSAMMEKAKSLSLSEMNDLMNVVLPCVTTNLTQGKVLSLLLHAGEYLDYEVDSGRIPFDGSWRNLKVRGMDVLGIDFRENKEYWLERVYGR